MFPHGYNCGCKLMRRPVEVGSLAKLIADFYLIQFRTNSNMTTSHEHQYQFAHRLHRHCAGINNGDHGA